MLSPTTFNKLNRKLHSQFNTAKKSVIELKLESEATTGIIEILDAQYLMRVKKLHDMDEPVSNDKTTEVLEGLVTDAKPSNGTEHVHVEMPKG